MTREVCEHFNPVDMQCAKCEEKRKSEALFLADELEIPLGTVIGSEVHRRAAAELRRLHAENEALQNTKHYEASLWRLRRITADLLEALKQIEPILARMYGPQAAELPPMQIVRATIAKAEEEIDSIWDSKKAFADIYAIARAIVLAAAELGRSMT